MAAPVATAALGGAADGSNAADSAPVVVQQGPQSVAPAPPPPYGGGGVRDDGGPNNVHGFLHGLHIRCVWAPAMSLQWMLANALELAILYGKGARGGEG